MANSHAQSCDAAAIALKSRAISSESSACEADCCLLPWTVCEAVTSSIWAWAKERAATCDASVPGMDGMAAASSPKRRKLSSCSGLDDPGAGLEKQWPQHCDENRPIFPCAGLSQPSQPSQPPTQP